MVLIVKSYSQKKKKKKKKKKSVVNKILGQKSLVHKK